MYIDSMVFEGAEFEYDDSFSLSCRPNEKLEGCAQKKKNKKSSPEIRT